MLKPILFTVLGVVVVAIVALVAVASRRPDDFVYTRSLKIASAPENIYRYIVDFRRWTQWSPYETLDAELGRRYSGPDTGVGATYAWEGKKAGKGSMVITRAEPGREIGIDLHFVAPMKADNVAEFTLEPEADGTQVTWTMRGKYTLFTKVVNVVVDIEKMVGGDFAKGLASLKRISESAS